MVGIGPGTGLLALLDTGTPASVVVLDPSDAMVRAARRHLSRHRRAGTWSWSKLPRLRPHRS